MKQKLAVAFNKNMKNKDALFLDFDGVLVESVAIKSNAFRELYAGQPPEILARIMEYHSKHDGISRVVKIRHCHEYFLGVNLSQSELNVWVRRYAQLVEDAVVRAPWVPGAKELLETQHKRCPLFIVSGTPEEELKRIVERRNMMPWFTDVRGSPTTKADIVRALLAEHHLTAERCLFIGDAMADLIAAHETGLQFLGRVRPERISPFPAKTKTIGDLSEVVL